MKDQPLARGQTYLLKLATSTATARVEAGLSMIDLDTRRAVAADAVGPNEVGHCTLTLDRPIALDRYEDCRDTGSFILIDPETFDTVAMGCVEETAPPQSRSRLATWLPKRAGAVSGKLTRWTETHARSFVKAVSWRATEHRHLRRDVRDQRQHKTCRIGRLDGNLDQDTDLLRPRADMGSRALGQTPSGPLSFAGEILWDAGMRHLGAPDRLRRVAAAADEARYAGRDHRADAHDVAVLQGR
jgi:hypothetical protein